MTVRRPIKKLYEQKNLLLTAGLIDSPDVGQDEIQRAFQNIETKVIDFTTGDYADIDPQTYDQERASRDPLQYHLIQQEKDIAGIKTRARYGKIYFAMDEGKISSVIIPVKGKGPVVNPLRIVGP